MSDPRFKTAMAMLKAPAVTRAGRGLPSGEAQIQRVIQHSIVVATVYGGVEAEQFILPGTDPNDKVRTQS
jgi:hypothetical protein